MEQEPNQQPPDQRRTFITIGILFTIGVIIWLLERASTIGWGWTGFGTKTLWDWLELLILPVVFGVVAYLFRQAEKRSEQRITADNQREAALQTYLGRMSELLLKEHLRESQEGDGVRAVARSLTFTVLRMLDPERKGLLIKFLYEADLISRSTVTFERTGYETGIIKQNTVILDLNGADLHDADLRDATLHDATLDGATLDGATLSYATLDGANLSYATLSGAKVTDEQLAICKTLEGATLPDGTECPTIKTSPQGGSSMPQPPIAVWQKQIGLNCGFIAWAQHRAGRVCLGLEQLPYSLLEPCQTLKFLNFLKVNSKSCPNKRDFGKTFQNWVQKLQKLQTRAESNDRSYPTKGYGVPSSSTPSVRLI